MENVNKSYRRSLQRYNSKRKALRKKKLAALLYPDAEARPYYSNLHQYSKNKIHCSCPICSGKVATHGYTHSDLKKLEKINCDLKENI